MKHRAFTLIELLLVVAIIGLLAGLSLGPITTGRKLTRDADRKADLTILSQAVDLYVAEKKILPGQAGLTCDTYSSADHGNWEDFGLLLETYLPASVVFPKDPLYRSNGDDDEYFYRYECDARTKSYILTAFLENKNDLESSCRDSSVPCTGRKYEIRR